MILSARGSDAVAPTAGCVLVMGFLALTVAIGGWITGQWIASISTVVASMRFARNRSSSGEIVRSGTETAYQAGLDRQAATVVLSWKSPAETRPCIAYSMRATSGSTPLAKSLTNASSVSAPDPFVKTRPALAGGAGNRRASANRRRRWH
jgi:hypothetical protein